jgi:nucleotide-binding universal stress UspA family protein
MSAPFPDLEHPLPGIQEIIDRARMRLEEAGVSGECTWRVGDPAQVILDVAREQGASRIMIGAHHHGFFGRLFGYDVDAEVQKGAAECEVVLVE